MVGSGVMGAAIIGESGIGANPLPAFDGMA
jgi:hypothetical protein